MATVNVIGQTHSGQAWQQIDTLAVAGAPFAFTYSFPGGTPWGAVRFGLTTDSRNPNAAGFSSVWLHLVDCGHLTTNPGTVVLGGLDPGGASTVYVWGIGCPDAFTINYSVSSAASPCQYGSESKPGAPLTFEVTAAIIDAIVLGALLAVGQVELVPYVETFLAAIEGTTPFAIDCSRVPLAAAAPLDLRNPATVSPDNLRLWLQNAAWNYFCICTPAPPGQPDPVAPMPPPVLAPPGVALPAPTIPCDERDICATLNHLEQLVSQIGTQLSYVRADVRLMKQQQVPFQYLAGTLHTGLSGAGQFSVSGILGLAVQVTDVPGAAGEEAGDPVARFGLGWVTTGTPDGWRRSVPIRHNPQWVDVQFDDTLVGYSLEPLVVANIEEFSRIP